MVIYYILRADYLSHVMERLKARPESWQNLEVLNARDEFCDRARDFYFLAPQRVLRVALLEEDSASGFYAAKRGLRLACKDVG